MTHQQTTSSNSTEILGHIHDMVTRLEVPSDHLFKQLFWTEKRRLQKEHAHLLHKRSSLKDQGYAAAVRILLSIKDTNKNVVAPRQSYLARIKSGGY